MSNLYIVESEGSAYKEGIHMQLEFSIDENWFVGNVDSFIRQMLMARSVIKSQLSIKCPGLDAQLSALSCVCLPGDSQKPVMEIELTLSNGAVSTKVSYLWYEENSTVTPSVQTILDWFMARSESSDTEVPFAQSRLGRAATKIRLIEAE